MTTCVSRLSSCYRGNRSQPPVTRQSEKFDEPESCPQRMGLTYFSRHRGDGLFGSQMSRTSSLDPDTPVRFLGLQCPSGDSEPVVLPARHPQLYQLSGQIIFNEEQKRRKGREIRRGEEEETKGKGEEEREGEKQEQQMRKRKKKKRGWRRRRERGEGRKRNDGKGVEGVVGEEKEEEKARAAEREEGGGGEEEQEMRNEKMRRRGGAKGKDE
ncbi:hypothetical protein WMY93_030271 [Mugilogobius chulae]|uniref:Uncharacterized protein n=1 Tax=Mugilogobius chulae TaxID=88201 RepID=A0AAW0MXE3_9GOBI